MNLDHWDDSPEQARVNHAQLLLLPNSPRRACEGLGLNWWAVLKLWEDDWLSFDPEMTVNLDEAQEAELSFVGSLVVGGCDPAMLSRLLGGLRKPYSYDGKRIYYDWPARRWRLLPDERNLDSETVFSMWINQLKEESDSATLERLADVIVDTLSDLKSSKKAAPARSA